MKGKMNRSMKVILPFLLILLFSCAAAPTIPSPSPVEQLRANLGTIGVVSGRFQPDVGFHKPMGKGAAALHGAGAGAGFVAQAGAGCSGIGCAGVLALIPVGAAVGGIIGAVKGIPSSKIKESQDGLNSYLSTVDFQETMRERFLSVVKGQTQNAFVLIEGEGPNALDEEVTYGSLSDKGIDTVLEISVRKCDLRAAKYLPEGGTDKRINPHLRLLMAVGTRLIRIEDGKVLWCHIFISEYESNLLKFSEWSVNNAQPFREELDRAFQYLATEIVKALSMIQTPPDPEPLPPTPPPSEGEGKDEGGVRSQHQEQK
ncbi:MAG TPA: hypothetical protein VLK23_09345 [Thermodesulfobacteriota bacterium]|nr:hypothetical protein [Thermodesulfobacteriota bacterium]